MRATYIVFCVTLTLMMSGEIPGTSASAQTSTSQLSTSPTSDTLNVDLGQSAFDPLGFDSGLWRSEYRAQHNDGEDAADSQSGAAYGRSFFAGYPTGPVQAEKSNTVRTPLSSGNLKMIPGEIPIVIGTTERHDAGASAEQHTTRMSDWETAAAAASGNTTIGLTTSGPSAISAIVGFAGIAIVIGAYASSGNQKQ